MLGLSLASVRCLLASRAWSTKCSSEFELLLLRLLVEMLFLLAILSSIAYNQFTWNFPGSGTVCGCMPEGDDCATPGVFAHYHLSDGRLE